MIDPIAQIYIDKDDDNSLIDDKSLKRELEILEDSIPETSDKEDKSLKDKLTSDGLKTIVKTITR